MMAAVAYWGGLYLMVSLVFTAIFLPLWARLCRIYSRYDVVDAEPPGT